MAAIIRKAGIQLSPPTVDTGNVVQTDAIWVQLLI